MSHYIVSARKYRPSTFLSVVGQRSLTTTLKNAITGNQLAHAYLFCGPRGVGKTTCARIFAKTINCQDREADGEACNACESCISFNEQRSYNIHELDAASNNSVEDIRSLIDQVRIPPQIGKYSVYIIDEVHMLSQSAFNAFLKTLEEPPAHAVFILATTEKHKILPTILSHCQIYDFNRISISDTVEHLQAIAQKESVEAEIDALNVIAQKADSGMRDALSIFDQIVSFSGNKITYKDVIENLNVLDYEYYFKLTDALLENKVVDAMLIFNEIISKGFEAQHFITGLSSHFRDLLMCKDMATVVLLEVSESTKKRYLVQAEKCPQEFLYKAIELSNECDLNYRLSRNKRLLVELTLIRLSQLTDSKKKALNETENNSIKPVFEQPKQSENTQPTPTVPIIPTEPAVKKEVTVSVPEVSAPTKTNLQKPPKSISISINSNVVNKPAEQENKPQMVQEPQMQYVAFTQDALSQTWTSFVKSLDKDIHIIKMIEKIIPTKQQGNSFLLRVANSMQQDAVLEMKGEILAFLRSALQNSAIDFTVSVDETSIQKPTTNQDRFNEMLNKNEDFRRLANDLSLEI